MSEFETVRFFCRQCGARLREGSHECGNCQCKVVAGLPWMVQFPLGLALGITLNLLRYVLLMVISFGTLVALPGRWVLPIYRSYARVRVGRGNEGSYDLRVPPSVWQRRLVDDGVLQEGMTRSDYECLQRRRSQRGQNQASQLVDSAPCEAASARRAPVLPG